MAPRSPSPIETSDDELIEALLVSETENGATINESEERCDIALNDSSIKASLDHLSNTLTWDNLPEWMRDNAYIQRGYRRQQDSFKGCIRSVYAYFHNETVNIHTHLWGAVFFAVLLVVTFVEILWTHPSATWHDFAGFAIFLIAAITCLFLSATFHTVNCHSLQVAKTCVALDYTGILILIVGSFFPSLYYGFYCYKEFQTLYLTTIVSGGIGAGYIVLTPKYSTPDYRALRTAVFVGLGLAGVIPAAHTVVIHGSQAFHEIGLGWLILSGALYINGAVLYATRTPERFFPGKLDYVGASHQIFHVHVVAAAICHYISLYTAYNHIHGTKGAMCPVPNTLS